MNYDIIKTYNKNKTSKTVIQPRDLSRVHVPKTLYQPAWKGKHITTKIGQLRAVSCGSNDSRLKYCTACVRDQIPKSYKVSRIKCNQFV